VNIAARARRAGLVRVRHFGPRMNSLRRSVSIRPKLLAAPPRRPRDEHLAATSPVASAPMSDRTLVLLKPDTVERKLVGEVVSRFEAKNLDIVAMELRRLDADTLARHYEEHVGKGFYDELVAFMSRGPVVAMVVEGPEDTWEVVRKMMGATNPRTAEPGTVRGDLGILFTENLVHGSDSLASAEREISIFFPNL
jgi:nucleoside-diphosphate kinase